jgi:dTDP-4-amino-4,6-dideoxygalactose transaminase
MGIPVIEDAAQAIGACFKGKPLGAFGDLGCLSFHSTKNITCGEGGAVIVNKDGLSDTIRIKREKGTNRALFLEGKIAKYTWIDVGSSFVISDVLAAILLEQLKKLEVITERRREICARYAERLAGLADMGFIVLPEPHPDSRGNGHIFWLLLHKGISRREFIWKLRRHGIEATHHYVPLHSSPFGIKNLGYKKGDMPITEDAAARLVRLPVHADLSCDDIDRVADTVNKILLKDRPCRKR